MNFQSIPSAKQAEDIYAQKELFQLGKLDLCTDKVCSNVRGLPLRLMNLLSAAMKESVVRSWTTSK